MAHVLLKKFLVFSIFFILVSVFVLNLDFSFASPPSTSLGQAPSDFGSSTLLTTYGLKEGDLISAIFSDDPDVYIVNEYGYKRLFLNPEIFKFYSHLGGFTNVKLVTSEVRDSFPTTGLFRNCEDKDQKVFGIDVEGEDQGQLHWVNTTGDQAVKADPNFFRKVFCINKKEFNWYKKASEFNSIIEVPKYDRVIETAVVSTKERLESKAETKHIGKVAICHYPPENIKAYQTLTIDASALKAHLDHGDTVGVCLSPAPTPVSTSSPQATPSTSPGPTASPSATPIPSTSSGPTVSPSASPISSVSFSPTPVPTSSPQATPSTSSGPTASPSATPTPTPTLVTATQTTSNKIAVSWSQTAKTFYIHRSVNGGTYQPLSGTVGTYFEDSNVSVGSTYRYRIHDCSDLFYSFCATTGIESNTITLTTTLTPTPTPTPTETTIVISNVTVTNITTNSATLTFTTNVAVAVRVSGIFSQGAVWEPPNSDYTRPFTYISGSHSILLNQLGSLQSGKTYNYELYVFDANGRTATYNGSFTTLASPTPTPTPTPTTSSVSYDNFSKDYNYAFNRDLYFGLKGNDVKQLQALLVNEVGYSANLVTGYFGNITRDAVKRLQEKYGVKPVLGYFGAITRGAIKVLISN